MKNIPKLNLVIWPEKSLNIPAPPFPEKDLNSRLVRNTAGQMIKLMYEYCGSGLSAQQVGVPFAIFVMDSQWTLPGNKKKARIFLNPRIINVGKGVQQLAHPGEGCLSFPYGYKQPIKRHDKIELEWLDFYGNKHTQWFENYEAIIIQHETDHVLGHLFIDRLSPLKRDMAIRRAKKIRRRYLKGYKKTLSNLKNAPRTFEYNLKRQRAFEEGFRSGGKNNEL